MAFRFTPRFKLRHPAFAQAVLLLATLPTQAQIAESTATQTVTVTGSNAGNRVGVAGFGDIPLSRTPFSATVIGLGRLQDAAITGIGDLTRLDAGITDAYNAPVYWGQLAVRGFTLDNRYNYRRDGLPINAETAVAQGNKQTLEILKGTSGLQAGTSAPGGLVNLVVKRPRDQITNGSLGYEQDASFGAAVDGGGAKVAWAGASTPAPIGWTRPPTTAGASAPWWRRRLRPNSTPAACWRPSSSGAAKASPARRASACWVTNCPARTASTRAST